MADPIELEVITATETAVKESILELYIPAYYGEAGILANHLPYISILKFGEISYLDLEKKNHYLYIENGFMEVRNNRIVIISDLTLKGENIDQNDTDSALEEINKKIRSASEGDITAAELKTAIIEQKKLTAKSVIAGKSVNK
ncbi:MAG: ATP synthase F1 subunit epsilon [Acidobacteriota bacterium]